MQKNDPKKVFDQNIDDEFPIHIYEYAIGIFTYIPRRIVSGKYENEP